MPIEPGGRAGRRPGLGLRRGLAGAVRKPEGLVDLGAFDPSLGKSCLDQAALQAAPVVRLAMHEEDAPGRPARLGPADQGRAVGVTGIGFQHLHPRPYADLLALDTDAGLALLQEPPERAGGLEADQQHRRLLQPQQALEVVTDPAGVAHPAGGDDDVPPAQPLDRPALVRGFRRMEQS